MFSPRDSTHKEFLRWSELSHWHDNRFSKYIIYIFFVAVLALFQIKIALYIAPILLAILIWPAQRISIISLGTILILLMDPHLGYGLDPRRIFITALSPTWLIPFGTILALAAFIALQNQLKTIENHGRRLVTGLTISAVTYITLIALYRSLPSTMMIQTVVATTAIALSKFIWYFAYDLQSKEKAELLWWQKPALYRPFWSIFFYAPIPKGFNFWSKWSLHDPKQLSALRVRSILLAGWAATLVHAQTYFENSILNIVKPIGVRLSELGHFPNPSLQTAWLSVIADFLNNILLFTAYGHLIVAILWFVGINAPLNTERPLTAKDPLDFFQRYNFYYKELLFDIFFFPIFARLSGLNDRVRIALSVFAAVGIGNFIVIYLRNSDFLLSHGFLETAKILSNYLIYCALLSILLIPFAIQAFSLRSRKIRKPIVQLTLTLITVLLFAAIRIFDEQFNGDVLLNIRFFALLFGASI